MQRRNFLFILISSIFFMIYLFIIYANYTQNRNYLIEKTKENQIKLVHSYKEKFDEKLLALKHIVESLGQHILTKDRKKDFWNIKESLTNAMNSGIGFTSVYISYPDNFTISGVPDWFYYPEYIATQRPWYKEAVEKGKTTITQPYEGSRGFVGFYISIVAPYYDKSGNLQAVMSSDLEIEGVKEELAKLLSPKDGFAFLMTRGDTIISKLNKIGLDLSDGAVKSFLHEFHKNKKSGASFKYNGNSYIFTYEALENSDWLFVSVLHEDRIYEELQSQLMKNLLASFVLFGLGVGGFIFLTFTLKSLYAKHALLGLFAKSPTWAVLLTNKDGKISFVNKAFENTFSLKSKSVNNMPFDELLKHLHVKSEIEFEKLQNSSEVNTFNMERKGRIYRVQITPLFKQKEEFEGIITTVNDITHEKALEIKEQEHEQILIQNSKMAALGEMVSAISHQWRQPLSTLLMLISNAEDKVEEDNKEKAMRFMKRSRETIEHMNETIHAFRNFYKEDFGQTKYDVTQVINDVILISTPQMQMNGIELGFTCKDCKEYICYGYPSYLKQVLINLIGNSKDSLCNVLKEKPLYEASIHVDLVSDKDGYYISVEDNGEGISEENAKKIFEPFFTTKGEFGTGTGLHLCKLLVESKMDGSLALVSNQNPTKFLIFIGRGNV